MKIIFAFSFGVLLAAAPAVARVVDVSITEYAFTPNPVSVSFGDTVRWTNNGAFSHTATSGKSDSSPGLLWDSPFLAHGQTYDLPVTFTGADIPYFCRLHYLTMKGFLTALTGVEEAGPASALRLSVRSLNPRSVGIDVPDTRPVSLVLYDAAGQPAGLILSRARLNAGRHDVPLSGLALASGFYFLRLEDGEIARTARIAILR
jgi:plastocyanin